MKKKIRFLGKQTLTPPCRETPVQSVSGKVNKKRRERIGLRQSWHAAEKTSKEFKKELKEEKYGKGEKERGCKGNS